VRTSLAAAISAIAPVFFLCACGREAAPPETLRAVRTAEIRYDSGLDTIRYFGSVQSRYEVDQAFRVGGKVIERRVDVGQSVHEGDVVAVLDDEDYRLAVEAARQQFEAAMERARQAESDWRRLQALKADGSVSDSDDEHAESELRTSRAAAAAEARKLDLARNQVSYAVLRASSSGVITSVRIEVGQVVNAGQPAIAIADDSTPEIVVDVPEDDLEAFKTARYRATLAATSDESFELALRELSAQAAAQTRTYRARLKPATPRSLPLGATATLIAERVETVQSSAPIPASALTQSEGDPALWVVRREAAHASGTVALVPVTVREYRSEEVLISGPPAGTLVVTAGVQKMAPGLRVALPDASDRVEAVKVADAR
jgi:membrane fusion protein, multidrug efflux system